MMFKQKFTKFTAIQRPWHAVLLTGAALLSLPALAQDDALLDAGRKLFNQQAVPACAICHTLKDAGALGQVGPVLDDLKPDADRVGKALRNGIGQMPAYGSLSAEQIDLLSRYIAKATGAAK